MSKIIIYKNVHQIDSSIPKICLNRSGISPIFLAVPSILKERSLVV